MQILKLGNAEEPQLLHRTMQFYSEFLKLQLGRSSMDDAYWCYQEADV